MSFINKVKNFFYEDVEEDDEEFEAREAEKRRAKLRKEEEKRRKHEQARIEKLERQEKIDNIDLSKPTNDDLSERELFKSEKTFNFPMDLGDNIFDKTETMPQIQEETRKDVKEEKNLYARKTKAMDASATNIRSSYKPEPVEEPKKFHPSPVVSPIYGVLDKNYTVDDVVDRSLSKTKEFSLEKKAVDFDTVRNKAYKDLDDEIEKTFTNAKNIFYNLDEEEKKEENDGTINDYVEEEYNKDENETEDVIITYEGEEETPSELEIEEDLTPDVAISVEAEVKDEKKEKKTRRSKKEEKEEDESEEKEDLFNLIDNMYNDEEDEEEEE